MTVAEIDGPAAITRMHFTRHLDDPLTRRREVDEAEELRALGARGVVLEIAYDGEAAPAVEVPLADFFADGALGRGHLFSTSFVEKSPGAYNCGLVLPFRESAVVRLRNETDRDLLNYSVVEFVRLAEWTGELAYLHASWSRRAFQLDRATDERLLTIDGPGRLVGQAWTMTTDDPVFERMAFVMEGNIEIRVDGHEHPTHEYLGTEDAFGFSYGFQEPFAGLRSGITYVQGCDPAIVAMYRFRDADAVTFSDGLDLRVDWTNEFSSPLFTQRIAPLAPDRDWLPPGREPDTSWVDYAMTTYWYAPSPRRPRLPLPPLCDRVAPVLRPNRPR